MQQNFNGLSELKLAYEVGTADILCNMESVKAKKPFSEDIINFLNTLSRTFLSDSRAKAFPDVVTLAFWMRRASVEALKKRFTKETEEYRFGRGVAFHVAPSNVPVNYAYSLITGLLCGNANIVRIPSKEFEQVDIINRAINAVLKEEEYKAVRPYILLIRYGHDSEINDALSGLADVRIVWGGDATIQEFRKSRIKPRATEITFADRYSLAVIDSDAYMAVEDKKKTANDFYNDTYLTDQNACTSPRLVAWLGSNIEEAQKVFWENLHALVKERYSIQGVQAVNKLTSGYLAAAMLKDVKKKTCGDNLIVRIQVPKATKDLIKLKDNSGYFFEVSCKNVTELAEFCDDTGCQTIAYIGKKEMLLPLVKPGGKGIDRIVPIGKTMDFDLIWDGYDLVERLTRRINSF